MAKKIKHSKGPWSFNQYGEIVTKEKDDFGKPQKLVVCGVSLFGSGSDKRCAEAIAKFNIDCICPNAS